MFVSGSVLSQRCWGLFKLGFVSGGSTPWGYRVFRPYSGQRTSASSKPRVWQGSRNNFQDHSVRWLLCAFVAWIYGMPLRVYLEDHGDLGSIRISRRKHRITPVIPIIHILTTPSLTLQVGFQIAFWSSLGCGAFRF